MSALARLNQHPLNQEAKRRLLAAKADLTNDQPYLLQLMWWGLEQAKLGLAPEAVRELRAHLEPVILELLDNPDKTAVQEYLLRGTGDHQENPQLSLRTMQTALTPEEAAYRALDSLASLVSADLNREQNYLNE